MEDPLDLLAQAQPVDVPARVGERVKLHISVRRRHARRGWRVAAAAAAVLWAAQAYFMVVDSNSTRAADAPLAEFTYEYEDATPLAYLLESDDNSLYDE